MFSCNILITNLVINMFYALPRKIACRTIIIGPRNLGENQLQRKYVNWCGLLMRLYFTILLYVVSSSYSMLKLQASLPSNAEEVAKLCIWETGGYRFRCQSASSSGTDEANKRRVVRGSYCRTNVCGCQSWGNVAHERRGCFLHRAGLFQKTSQLLTMCDKVFSNNSHHANRDPTITTHRCSAGSHNAKS